VQPVYKEPSAHSLPRAEAKGLIGTKSPEIAKARTFPYRDSLVPKWKTTKKNNRRRNDYWRTIIFVSAILESGTKNKSPLTAAGFLFSTGRTENWQE
jgi:hypothetical protein